MLARVAAVTWNVARTEAPGATEENVAGPDTRAVQPTAPQVVAGPRPDVVLFMIDDMRDDDLRWMPRTRQLLGGSGVRFVNSFSPYPSCCPARASALSGLYTHNHHVDGIHRPYGFPSFDDRSTLATGLRWYPLADLRRAARTVGREVA